MQADTVLYRIASHGWAPSDWIMILSSVGAAIFAAFAAYFSSYAKKKGADLATNEGFLDALRQLKQSTQAIERIKSTVTVQAVLDQELRGAAQKLTVSLSSMIHSMCWLTWDTKSRGRLSLVLSAKYDEEVHRLSPDLSGQLALVASYNLTLHDQLAPLVTRAFALDAAIGTAMVVSEVSPASGLEQLTALHVAAGAFEEEHRLTTARILNAHFAAPTT